MNDNVSTHRTKKTKQNGLNQVRVLLPSTGAFVTQKSTCSKAHKKHEL